MQMAMPDGGKHSVDYLKYRETQYECLLISKKRCRRSVDAWESHNDLRSKVNG